MPKPQPPQTRSGPIHAVPCPFCGGKLDFRAHADQESGGTGWGEQGLEPGALVDCDHCGHTSKILAKDRVTIIKLQPVK